MTRRNLFLLIGISGVYLLLRLPHLTLLPVFADEAIYIRWAQLIQHDWARYLFFPIQDGKPPLFMMLLAPLMHWLPEDPLSMARGLSVCCGLFSLFLVDRMLRLNGQSRFERMTGIGLYLFMPYTFFYNRLGLIDTLLTTFLLLATVGLLMMKRHMAGGIPVLALGLGLALWTKTSALFFIPVYALFLVWGNKDILKGKTYIWFLSGITGGLLIFSLLLFSPTFPALFSRSQDFTFTIKEVLQGQVSQISSHFLAILRWLIVYTTLPVVLTLFAGFISKNRSSSYLLSPLAWLLGMGIFWLPFITLGKVVASRYLLPSVICIIPACTIIWNQWWQQQKILGYLLGIGVLLQAGWFMSKAMSNADTTPLPHEDTVAYLADWSSGHGIPQVRDYIRTEARSKRITVATEGFFGTLPDGLFMYFANSPLLTNLEIYGIGQPFVGISTQLLDKAKQNDTYLVVNSHRMLVPLPQPQLLLMASYPRPYGGPSLLLFKVVP